MNNLFVGFHTITRAFILACESDAVNVLLTILLLILSAGIIWLLYRSTKKERLKFGDVSVKETQLTGEGIKDYIRKKIEAGGKKLNFTVIEADLFDYSSMLQNFGKTQIANMMSDYVERFLAIMPEGSKAAFSDGSIIIYIKNAADMQQLDYLFKVILAETAKPYTLVGTLKVDIDINLCAASFPESGKTYDQLSHNLELAMIVSKRKGINQYVVYDKQLANQQTEEYQYYKEIKDAIDNKEFTLFFQPIVNLADMEAAGCESLLRWNHKTLGVLPPAKFLNIIEHSGDIYWVGLWAFEQLVKQCQQWERLYPDKKLMFSINLSPKQLMNGELVNDFRRIIKKHKGTPSNYCMEIVDFAMFEKVPAIAECMQKLRQAGFLIGLDNYSVESVPLSILSKMPVDVIKLDRSLAPSAENGIIVNYMDMLTKHSKENNIMLVAEGLEDRDNIDAVKKLGVGFGQGYVFGKPKPPEEIIVDINMTTWND